MPRFARALTGGGFSFLPGKGFRLAGGKAEADWAVLTMGRTTPLWWLLPVAAVRKCPGLAAAPAFLRVVSHMEKQGMGKRDQPALKAFRGKGSRVRDFVE